MLHFVVTFEVPLQSCGFALQCCSRVRFLSLSTFSLNPKNFCTTECKASVLFCFVFRSHHSQRGFPLHLFSCFHLSSFRSCQQAAASLALSLFTLPASLSLSWHFLALSFVQGRGWSAWFHTTDVPDENAADLFGRSHRSMNPDASFNTINGATPRDGVSYMWNFTRCCLVVLSLTKEIFFFFLSFNLLLVVDSLF